MIEVRAVDRSTVLVAFEGDGRSKHETYALAHRLAAECYESGIAANARVEVWSPGGNAWLRVTTKEHVPDLDAITSVNRTRIESILRERRIQP